MGIDRTPVVKEWETALITLEIKVKGGISERKAKAFDVALRKALRKLTGLSDKRVEKNVRVRTGRRDPNARTS